MWRQFLGKIGLVKAGDEVDAERLEIAVNTVSEFKDELLKMQLDGQVYFAVLEDHSDFKSYDEARRRPWAFSDAGYPACVALIHSVEDIQKVLKHHSKFTQALQLAVAGGGHSSFAMVDNAIVIDLCNLKSVSADVESKTVTVGGGCKIEDVEKVLEPLQLGFVTGTNGDTGVGGLTLSGGFGFLSRKHGFACDNMIEAQVVLATGDIVVASESQNAELLIGLRGGGGNFGIVTSFKFKLHDVSNCMGGYSVRFAPTTASCDATVKRWRDAVDSDLPDDTAAIVALPAGPVVVICGSVIGDRVATETDPNKVEGLSFISKVGGWFQLQNTIKKASYFTHLQTLMLPFNQPKFSLVSSLALSSLTDQVIEGLTALVRNECPTSDAVLIIFRMGGQAASVEEASILSHRDAKYWCIFEGNYQKYASPDIHEKAKAWMLKVKTFLMSNSGIEMAYPMYDANLKASDSSRLSPYVGAKKILAQKLKQKYDPSNVFQLNKNVKPESTQVTM